MSKKIGTCLWFDRKAEEAARFYVSLLPDSRIDSIVRAIVETPGASPGDVLAVEFILAGASYMALNGGPQYKFTHAVSVVVHCADQAEVDRLWDALTADGGSPVACGWLTDRYGLSWQIVPKGLLDMLKDKDTDKARRATQAMMQMVKLDIAALRAAYEGRTAA
jgi:predicted 3-demethylubiquinone-9 3-methyltransferase (glyoxalase superfamily)